MIITSLSDHVGRSTQLRLTVFNSRFGQDSYVRDLIGGDPYFSGMSQNLPKQLTTRSWITQSRLSFSEVLEGFDSIMSKPT